MRLVVCYDASSVSKEVVKLAQEFAQGWEGSIEVVSAIKRDQPIPHAKLKLTEDEFNYEVKQMFRDSKIQYTCHLLVDHFEEGEQIIKYAKSQKADFIFVGIKRVSKVGKLLFGSTAQYIILKSPCPVVTLNQSKD